LAAERSAYMYAWEYCVRAEHTAEFEQMYGLGGGWVELFQKAEGYLRTELFRDQSDENRYMTIDLWVSHEAWLTFRERFATEFEELDKRCEQMTDKESELGRFELI